MVGYKGTNELSIMVMGVGGYFCETLWELMGVCLVWLKVKKFGDI